MNGDIPIELWVDDRCTNATFPVNAVPLSDSIFSGHPWTDTIFSSNTLEVVSDNRSFTGTTSTHLVRRSVNTKICL
ncbi:hypothetical protein AYI69_g9734 [Smittium culicis]|uniref:Uncharacterized protein n=1 Tax=Smittium culicis TaxID=133412 RepID=A0A1R1XAN2_9FUNG|nr:hypothetical protein AYI69_g9734 [Smittium culicis]